MSASLRGVLIGIGLLLSGCARPPPPVAMLPTDPASAFLASISDDCRRIQDYEARGRVLFSGRYWESEVRATLLYRGRDRIRVAFSYPGLLGLGGAGGDVLFRGDSLYLEIRPGVLSWRGTRDELGRTWPGAGALILATVNEFLPGGPVGCGCPVSPLDVEVADGEVALWAPAGTLDRVLWIDAAREIPVESHLYDQSRELVGSAVYDDYLDVDGWGRPTRIRLNYPREGAEMTVLIEDEWSNRDLSEERFDPPGSS